MLGPALSWGWWDAVGRMFVWWVGGGLGRVSCTKTEGSSQIDEIVQWLTTDACQHRLLSMPANKPEHSVEDFPRKITLKNGTQAEARMYYPLLTILKEMMIRLDSAFQEAGRHYSGGQSRA